MCYDANASSSDEPYKLLEVTVCLFMLACIAYSYYYHLYRVFVNLFSHTAVFMTDTTMGFFQPLPLNGFFHGIMVLAILYLCNTFYLNLSVIIKALLVFSSEKNVLIQVHAIEVQCSYFTY